MAKKQKVVLHKNMKGKEFPKEITALIEKAADSFLTAAEYCQKAIEKGKEYGIDAKEIGDRLRDAFLKRGLSLRTIQRYLPAEAKALPRGVTVAGASARKAESETSTENEEFSDKNVANEPAISQRLKDHLESLPENPNPPKSQQQETDSQRIAKKFERPNEEQQQDLMNEHIDTLEAEKEELEDEVQGEYKDTEINKLKARIAELEKENEELKTKLSQYENTLSLYREHQRRQQLKQSKTKQPQDDTQNSTPAETPAANQPKKSKQSKEKQQYVSYEESSKYAQSQGITAEKSGWRPHVKSGKLPANIPNRPDSVYKKTGEWKGWDVFFGKPVKDKGVIATVETTVEAQV